MTTRWSKIVTVRGMTLVSVRGLTLVTVRVNWHLVPSYPTECALSLLSSFLHGNLAMRVTTSTQFAPILYYE